VDEFAAIADLFAPLAKYPGARGLLDDAALYAGKVVTTDAIVEGVHFLPDDPLDTIAKKALRVNLSDLAAKGARPSAALLTLIWPDARAGAEIADFARGLGEDLALYGVALLGGDTTRTPGPLTVSITAFGAPAGARTPARSDAQVGDDVWVSGAIGDAWLGLEALQGRMELADAHRAQVIARYRLPQPRVALAELVAAFAHASMDVSDGLAGDAGKLASLSGVRLEIEARAIPLSAAGAAWRAQTGLWGRLLDFGDDYEILFTAPPADRARIAQTLGVTRIGRAVAGQGVAFHEADGTLLQLAPAHAHRLGR